MYYSVSVSQVLFTCSVFQFQTVRVTLHMYFDSDSYLLLDLLLPAVGVLKGVAVNLTIPGSTSADSTVTLALFSSAADLEVFSWIVNILICINISLKKGAWLPAKMANFLCLTNLRSNGRGDAASEVELLGHDQVWRGFGLLDLLRDGENLDERRERRGL